MSAQPGDQPPAGERSRRTRWVELLAVGLLVAAVVVVAVWFPHALDGITGITTGDLTGDIQTP